jgi:hypothetical protein
MQSSKKTENKTEQPPEKRSNALKNYRPSYLSDNINQENNGISVKKQ